MHKAIAAFVLASTSAALLWLYRSRRRHSRKPPLDRFHPPPIGMDGAIDLIGNTPMIVLPKLSNALGCVVLAKCEFVNPGGSPKDRVAFSILRQAEYQNEVRERGRGQESNAIPRREADEQTEDEQYKDVYRKERQSGRGESQETELGPSLTGNGLLEGSSLDLADSEYSLIDEQSSSSLDPALTVYEGTVGSTGIALAWLARAKGYRAHIVMPDDQAQEKYQLLAALGARVEKVRPAPITDPQQFCRVAQQRALEDPNGVFADQFENMANVMIHYERTGPEIWHQLQNSSFHSADYLVLGAGTGGTIAGCARYLKEQCPSLKVILADPPGSGLYNKVRHNVFYSMQEAEGRRRRQQVDTVVEGVGINRMTRNLEIVLGAGRWIQETVQAFSACSNQSSTTEPQTEAFRWIDDAITVTDREVACMARYMVDQEGLFLGSSSCVNLVACVKLARTIKNTDRPTAVVTMLCDGGQRHLTKFWNDDYLISHGILMADELRDPNFSASLADLAFVE